MKTKTFIFAVFIAVGCVVYFSCTRHDNTTNPSTNNLENGSANVTIQIERIGAFAKSIQPQLQLIELQNLYVTLSSGTETILDTLSLAGKEQKTFNKTYFNLTPLIDWTLSVESRDQNGAVIHSGSTVFSVQPGQRENVTLILDAKYSMLLANFYPIRDSVTTCQLLVDGVLRAETSFEKQTIVGDTVQLSWDYLTTDTTHTIKMDVYGDMLGVNTLLYTGDTTIAIVPGVDASYTITLYWVGPDLYPETGQATMSVYLGNIGDININGELELRDITEGLVAYYPFNGNANDESGNSNHGTVSGAVLTEDRYGNLNSAYYFDGVNDGITINDAPCFDFSQSNQLTISVWAMLEEGTKNKSIIIYKVGADSTNNTDDEWLIGAYLYNNLYYFRSYISDGPYNYNIMYNICEISFYNWYHIVLVWNGNNSYNAVYVNGNCLRSTNSAITTINNTLQTIRIGRGRWSHNFFKGKIDDIRIYDRALSEKEIQLLYNE